MGTKVEHSVGKTRVRVPCSALAERNDQRNAESKTSWAVFLFLELHEMVLSLLRPYPAFFQPPKRKFQLQGNGSEPVPGALLPGEWVHPREPRISLPSRLRLWSIPSQHPLSNRDGEGCLGSENCLGPQHARGAPEDLQLPERFCVVKALPGNDNHLFNRVTQCDTVQHKHLTPGWKKGASDAS